MSPVIRSLRFRLTAWYCLVLLGTLLAFATALYAVSREQFLRHHDDELIRAAGAVTEILREHEDCAQLTPDQQARMNEIGGLILIHDVNGEGQVFYRSSESARFPLPPNMLDRAPVKARNPWFETHDTSTGLVRVYSAPYRSHAGRSGLVRIMDPLGDVAEPLRALRNTLFYLAPLALLVAFAGGQWLAKRALRPVDDVTSKAREIEARNLSLRLPAPEVQDELGRLVATLNQMFERLETSFAGMQRFTADASHELRTPLATISGTIDVVLAKPRDAPEYEAALRSIAEDVESLRVIVDDLLVLARADAGGANLRLEPLQLDVVVADVVEALAPLAEKAGVTLRASIPEPITVLGDEPWLRQLVTNVLDNAIKFSSGADAPALVEVDLTRDGDDVAISIADRGPGLPEADLPRLFERFYRGEEARTLGTGFGLGLAISAWVAHAHGGTIEAANRSGGGSRFTIRLPIAS